MKWYTFLLGDSQFVPTYKGFILWSAVHEFLDIDAEATLYLFMKHSYDKTPTPKRVAKRIKEFMKNDFKISGRVPQGK